MPKKNKQTEEPAAQEPQHEETTQLRLLPDEPPVPVYQGMYDVNDLPVYSGVEPYPSLIETVKKAGVLVPLILRKTGERASDVRVIDGKRRRMAASECGIDMVPVIVYDVPDHYADSYLLMLHHQRKPNTRAELKALNSLLEHETNKSSLARQLGVALARVNRLLTLNDLIPALFAYWERGGLKDSLAFRIAKLSKESQALLARILEEAGTIKNADVQPLEPKQGTLDMGDTEIDRDTFVSRVKDAIIEADYDVSKASPEQLAEWLARRCFDGATISLKHVMEEVA